MENPLPTWGFLNLPRLKPWFLGELDLCSSSLLPGEDPSLNWEGFTGCMLLPRTLLEFSLGRSGGLGIIGSLFCIEIGLKVILGKGGFLDSLDLLSLGRLTKKDSSGLSTTREELRE